MYEQFEDKVIENVDCFLNLGCSANDDTHCKKSEYYRQNILNRKVDENGNKNKLKATMLWFVDVGAITPEDYSLFLNIKEARNIYVHQLTKCVVNGISDKDIDMLVQLLNLFYKSITGGLMKLKYLLQEYLHLMIILPKKLIA